jgi:hypothetical protein
MIIPDMNDELLRSPVNKANRAQAEAGAEKAEKLLPAVGRTDLDEIRPSRALIGGDSRAELSREHVAEIRQRISDGAYNTVEVANQVARRVLRSGDLDASE